MQPEVLHIPEHVTPPLLVQPYETTLLPLIQMELELPLLFENTVIVSSLLPTISQMKSLLM